MTQHLIFHVWLPKFRIFLHWFFEIHDFILLLLVYICNYIEENWQNLRFFWGDWLLKYRNNFVVYIKYYTNFLPKYAIALPKVGKIHPFFFHCVFFLNVQFLFKMVVSISSYFAENQKTSYIFCDWSLKFLFFSPTDFLICAMFCN